MELLVSLASKVSREYGFSAFAVALLMAIFYSIVTNKSLIKVADRVLNKSLKESNLYKFIRLSIILVLIFSTTVILLAFLTPVLMRSLGNTTLTLTLQAQQSFNTKDYTTARSLYERALLLNPDDATADQIRGMVTATYYAQNLHEDGLEFICREYKYRAQADRSFLFAVHAHIRAISVKSGPKIAETLAKKLRSQCGRQDFSEFWAHIPFGMMESLRTGHLRTEHHWELTENAKARISQLLDEKRQQSMSKVIPLADFVLYFLSRFDELITEMPDSLIRDIALLDAAKFSSGEKRIDYLKKLADEHPKSTRITDAIVLLAGSLADAGRRDEALSYIVRLQNSNARELAAEVTMQPTLNSLKKLTAEGNFAGAHRLAEDVCTSFTKNNIPCQKTLVKELEKLKSAVTYVTENPSNHNCIATQSKIRALAKTEDNYPDLSWFKGARSYLISCLETAEDDPEQYPKIIYLIAALSRKAGDYKTSFDYLIRFKREINDHALRDDVLAELGYHKLIIERDWPAAKEYFEEVISKYPDRNAYDNAVWWYAKGLKMQGEYSNAAGAYAEIASLTLKSRFREWSVSEQENLQRLAAMAPFTGISLRQSSRDNEGLYIQTIASDAPTAKILRTSDRLVRVCGKNVYSIEQVLNIVRAIDPSTECRILYIRGKSLLRIAGSISNGWHGDIIQITPNELRQLAYGLGEF